MIMQEFKQKLFAKAQITQPKKIGDYIIGKIIGRGIIWKFPPYVLGAFAAVRLALIKKTKKRVVFKIFEKKDLIKSIRRSSILSEIEILKNSSHPNIIKLISCLDTSE